MESSENLKNKIISFANDLGFFLAGVTTPDPPRHVTVFENWLLSGHHGNMEYLATERSRSRRANLHEILPECKSVLVLATPYSAPQENTNTNSSGQIAAYAIGLDYHDVLSTRMKELIQFIEKQVGHPIKNRYYSDTGPILERDLAQRAGIGWIGKNTCLINPKHGSYFFLSEILLDLSLEPDPPFLTDHCGTCTRCIEACPTNCILPNRTIDASQCISYLTIELKDDIPVDLRDKIGDWVFGCDICQTACPWNRFSSRGDPVFENSTAPRSLTEEMGLSTAAFNQRFKNSPIKRAKRRGYLRNVSIALGNSGNEHELPVLQNTLMDEDKMIRRHAQWAIDKIKNKTYSSDET